IEPQSFVWPDTGYRNDFKTGRVFLDPLSQNTPLAPDHHGLRPPTPRIPDVFDLFLGLPAYRDGRRCGYTLFTAYSLATHPYRVHAGVVDQTQDDDVKCLDEYCRLANEEWPDVTCKYKELIRVDARDSRKSDGPISVRAGMQKLIQDEEFCLTTDAHMQFLPHWDTELLIDWNRTQNEMAVLSTYVFGYEKIGPNKTVPTSQSSHLCMFGGHNSFTDMPWFSRLTIENSELPQMSPFWGGGLSFSKCHAEKRAPIDPHMTWIFIGEEFLRAMQLWTQGYDMYSPSRYGLVLFHNETKEHTRDNWQSNDDNRDKMTDGAQAYERLKMVLHFEVTGPVNGKELPKYYPRPVRSVEAFLNFTGISPTDLQADRWRCEQQHWVPYDAPEMVESFLQGYRMRPALGSVGLQETRVALKKLEEENHALLVWMDSAVGSNATRHADTPDGLVVEVQNLLLELRAASSVTAEKAQLVGDRNVLMDYTEVIAVQLVLVVAFVAVCVFRSKAIGTNK
ncbi:hypothetical protein As57867_004046, partial [Aphanomyces stellatus]